MHASPNKTPALAQEWAVWSETTWDVSTMETILGFLYGMYTYKLQYYHVHDWASYCAEVWECEQSNFHLAPRVVNKPGNKSISQGSGKYREIPRNTGK